MSHVAILPPPPGYSTTTIQTMKLAQDSQYSNIIHSNSSRKHKLETPPPSPTTDSNNTTYFNKHTDFLPTYEELVSSSPSAVHSSSSSSSPYPNNQHYFNNPQSATCILQIPGSLYTTNSQIYIHQHVLGPVSKTFSTLFNQLSKTQLKSKSLPIVEMAIPHPKRAMYVLGYLYGLDSARCEEGLLKEESTDSSELETTHAHAQAAAQKTITPLIEVMEIAKFFKLHSDFWRLCATWTLCHPSTSSTFMTPPPPPPSSHPSTTPCSSSSIRSSTKRIPQNLSYTIRITTHAAFHESLVPVSMLSLFLATCGWGEDDKLALIMWWGGREQSTTTTTSQQKQQKQQQSNEKDDKREQEEEELDQQNMNRDMMEFGGAGLPRLKMLVDVYVDMTKVSVKAAMRLQHMFGGMWGEVMLGERCC
jgi:hypothetical protein